MIFENVSIDEPYKMHRRNIKWLKKSTTLILKYR